MAGGYVRHRSRMVARSVYDDAKAVLDANGWTVEPAIGLLDVGEIVTFLDYFPEQPEGDGDRLPINTLALDLGTAEQPYEYELGGLFAQEYTFNFAFNARNDAIAMALFSDLADHYLGRTGEGFIALRNYVTAPPVTVVTMEVERFETAKSTEQAAPGVHLWFSQLVVTDYLDQVRAANP